MKGQSASVDVGRSDTASGTRLRIQEVSSGAEIFLDPIELEGLTRLRGTRATWFADLQHPKSEAAAPSAPSDLEVFQNEFAMVEVGRVETDGGPRLLIRDLASRVEAVLEPEQLRRLTHLRHRHFAPLLDPSELVAAVEPDPDEI